MSQWWWKHIPNWISRISPNLAVALSDGFYLTAWRPFGVIAPPVCLLLGGVLGWLHPGETFTFSLWLMALMISISSFSAGLGTWIWLGYAFGDFFLFDHFANHSLITKLISTFLSKDSTNQSLLFDVIHIGIPLLLSYGLLATLLISIPRTSQTFRRYALRGIRFFRQANLILDAVLQAIFQSILVFLWTQTVPILIRPVYTWQGDTPPIAAIQPLQSYGMVLVVLAALLGAVRVVLEYQTFKTASIEADFATLQQSIAGRSAGRHFIPDVLTTPVKAVFTTFMLSGMLSNWIEAVILGVSLYLTMLFRQTLPSRFSTWVAIVSRIPLLLRLVIASLINYFVALKVLEIMWSGASTFFPMIVGTIVSIFIFSLLLPTPKAPKASAAIGG